MADDNVKIVIVLSAVLVVIAFAITTWEIIQIWATVLLLRRALSRLEETARRNGVR